MKQKRIYQPVVMLAALMFYCCSFQAGAQEIMHIQKKDKSVVSIPVSEIEMIT